MEQAPKVEGTSSGTSALDDGLGRTVVVAEGTLSAWLEPMPSGFRSEELRPFLCATTSRPGEGTNVPAMLEGLLLALNGRDVLITIEVRPNCELTGDKPAGLASE